MTEKINPEGAAFPTWQDRIFGAYRNHAITKHNKPTRLLMHPEDGYELICELKSEGKYPYTTDGSLTIMGMKLIRSYDIEQNKFEVL